VPPRAGGTSDGRGGTPDGRVGGELGSGERNPGDVTARGGIPEARCGVPGGCGAGGKRGEAPDGGTPVEPGARGSGGGAAGTAVDPVASARCCSTRLVDASVHDGEATRLIVVAPVPGRGAAPGGPGDGGT
jgi:hypothetical protein